ncbi:hypothetical protein A2U01_0035255, partial [Trifolium medium]|nr:hypothetical protein [Trifolium medium]
MYRMQLQQGAPENPDYQMMAPHNFQTHVAWPRDRPVFSEGARDADDDAADEAATDAVDDDEATQSAEGDDDYDD